MSAEQDAVCSIRNMEQRRQSSIDQHWAMPNKVRSLDDEPSVHHTVQGISADIFLSFFFFLIIKLYIIFIMLLFKNCQSVLNKFNHVS